MYSAYSEKKDSPMISTFMYMTLLHLFIALSIFMYLEKILILKDVLPEITIDSIKRSYWFWIVLVLGVFLFTYFYYFQKSIDYYEELFAKSNMANKYVKAWMLAFLPFIILFLNIYIYIVLFGGHVFGKEVVGIFSK